MHDARMPTDIVTRLPAQQAHAAAAPGDHVIGWKLDIAERAWLLRRHAPTYARALADHVTLKPRVAADAALPLETEGHIVGRADDGHGVEAMVVEIGGSTRRPDGGTYHITWSLAKGRRPKESNDAIAMHGWQPLAAPIPVRLEPASFQ
jgi:hypothetical protein